jgi:hypothetical protein
MKDYGVSRVTTSRQIVGHNTVKHVNFQVCRFSVGDIILPNPMAVEYVWNVLVRYDTK